MELVSYNNLLNIFFKGITHIWFIIYFYYIIK